ncbi:hypothetical protein [Chryseobacterium sp.]|uniref:hypothetical protein n=1 Tax=Chryseobacterium sp. TaxID=1871047 RepID=UPI0025C4FA42|nr:hypothetical protein [Chryseobacterium sp.]
MKKIIILITFSILAASCSKKDTRSTSSGVDSTKIIDSINAVRTQINDSIRAKNDENRFKDFNGSHKFTHNLISKPGSVEFKKVERDRYEVSGNIKSGKNFVEIKGYMKIISDKHMNFTGEIKQSISQNDNGKVYTRKGTKTFLSKDGGKTWRLQDMVNSSGFVDYIDIHY